MLFKQQVYTETASMNDVKDVFAGDILYHNYCCKAYFNHYQDKIAKIMGNLDMEDSVAAKDDTFKARFLTLNLDFSKSTHRLTSIRDRLNEGSTDIVSNISVKQLIIELYGDVVSFTYPNNKRKSQMILCTNSSPYMFKGKTSTQLKIDVVFQILHYILTDGKEPTPFHVMVAQAVHSLT